MSKSLEELLARAVELNLPGADEVKAAAPATLEDALAVIADLKARLGDDAAALDGADDAELMAASSAPGDDPLADAEAEGAGTDFEDLEVGLDDEGEDFGGYDFDALPDVEDEPTPGDLDSVTPTGEEKAAGPWGPCPTCGSLNRDEYADGTARCEEDGTALTRVESKGHDFVAAEDDALEVKTGLSEIELLMHRRAELGV